MSRALPTSMPVRRACATGLRTKQAWSIPGSAMSSMKRPAPRRRALSSRRVTARPMKVRVVSSLPVAPYSSFTRSRPLNLLDHRAPLRELVPHVLVRAVRSIAEHRLEALLDQLRLERLVGPFGLRDLVQPLQNGCQGSDRREDSEEDLRHESVEPFVLRGRDLGRYIEPRRRVDGEDAQLAGAMQRHDLRRDVGKDDSNVAAEEIVHGGC